MRRLAVMLACVTCVTIATALPAAAHPIPSTSRVPVGRPGTVTIGIPSEATVAMTGVDIDIPAGYRVIKPAPPPGWDAAVRNGQVHFAHGKVVPGSFGLFGFRGRASKRGPLKFSLVIHSADGRSQRWDGVRGKDRYPAPVVFAGVPTPDAPARHGTNLKLLAGAGVIVFGAAMVIVVVRPWRRRTSDVESSDHVDPSAPAVT